LAANGVTLGAHSKTHRDLRKVRGGALEEEVRGSGQCLEERIGRFPAAFAYPFGTYDALAVEAAARTFDVACTTDLRPVETDDDRHRLPRLDAYYLREKGRLEAWGTPGFERYLRFRESLRRTRKWLIQTSKG
jgi:peptidoglycan/xylan/chitin deacetylase (PgdA/CDA1 family)